MKKFSLLSLIAAFLFGGNLMAQELEVLIDETFEEYTVGNKIAVESNAAGHTWWTTWSNHPGTSEDGVVAEFSDTKCGHLTYGNDQVLLLGDEDNGVYDLEFDILVPEGKNGYFNILHKFAGGNSKWAMQCYLHMTNDGQNSTPAPGHGTIHAGSNQTADVPCVYDAWMHFRLHVDTDADVAEYYYTAPGEDEILCCTWTWSLDSFGAATVGRKLAAMDFYPPEDAETSEYYLDNFRYTKIGGPSAPELSYSPQSVEATVAEDDVTTATVTVVNSGNSIGEWCGWMDFGAGAAGTQTATLAWHNGNGANGIGSQEESYTREMAIRLPASAYASPAMGMKINSVQFLVGSATSADHTYTFRIYGQGFYGQPGEVLAEKTIQSTISGDWLVADFSDEDIYMTGQEIWASCALLQNAGEYPLTMDDGTYAEESDGNWLSTDGSDFAHCWSSGNFAGAWLISVNCQGTVVTGTWADIDKQEGSIMVGASETITITMNTFGIEEGEYTANLVLRTNDENMPVITIPVTMHADYNAVEETAASAYNVYPNPTNGVVVVEGENVSAIAIYSATGQLINVVNTTTVDLSTFGAGVYYLNIIDSANKSTVQRVVVK